MTRPLELKSPDNAAAIGLYLGMAYLGLAVLKPEFTKIMGQFLGATGAPFWAVGVVLSGLGACVAAVATPRSSRPCIGLAVEMLCAVVLGALLCVFAWELWRSGLPARINIRVFSILGFALICRGAQIGYELRLLARAQRSRRTAVHTSLADPHDRT